MATDNRCPRRSPWLPPVAVFGFLAPNFLGFVVFLLFPLLLSIGMAFTNWTVKPGVATEWVGLRNFIDLLGVHPTGRGTGGTVVAVYAACGLGLLAGIVAQVWACLRGWRGRRLGGTVLACLGIAVIGVALLRHADHGFVLGGVVLLLLGVVGLGGEGSWRFGVGTVPGVVTVVATVGLFVLNGAMWTQYVPNDTRFWFFFYNTVYLMLGAPFAIAGSLGLALLLNEHLPKGEGRTRWIGAGLCAVCGVVSLILGFGMQRADAGLVVAVLWLIAGLGLAFNVVAFRTIYYLPSFTAGVAIMILWKALYNPRTGPINMGLVALTGLPVEELPQWLASTLWAKPSLMAMGIWTAIGGTNMLLYLAALSNVPQELVEAAKVDGAGPLQRFRHITIPQLAPTTFFIAIMSVIGGLQGGFEAARVMTGGGPDGATTTLSYYLYGIAFQQLDLGLAAAVSWVMFAIIFVATALNWQFGKELEVEG